MTDDWTEADDAIEEVHEIRRQIWARLGNDPQKVVAYYMELDKQYADRMIAMRSSATEDKSAA